MSRHTRYLKLGVLAVSAFLLGSTPVKGQQLPPGITPEMIQQAMNNPALLQQQLSNPALLAAIKANPAMVQQALNDPRVKALLEANPALKAQLMALINGNTAGGAAAAAAPGAVKMLFPPKDPSRMIINLKNMEVRQYNAVEYQQMQEQIKRAEEAGANPYHAGSHALKGRLEFVRIPAGSFLMGSSLSEEGRMADEERHEVQLTQDFWVGMFEISQEQWKAVMGPTDQAVVTKPIPGLKEVPKLVRGASLPMYNINQEEALLFCRRLTMLVRQAGAKAAKAAKAAPALQPKLGPDGKPVTGPDGKPVMEPAPAAPKAPAFVLPDDWEFTLPTEAQWEYVCRAGTQTAFAGTEKLLARDANYNIERIKREIVETQPQNNNNNNFDMGMPPDMMDGGQQQKKESKVTYKEEIYVPKIKPIGSCNPNAWGVYDMHGSVWEWCKGAYYLYPSNKLVDPQGARDGRLCVTRGGGWYSLSKDCRAARRQDLDRETRQNNIGFRVILSRKR